MGIICGVFVSYVIFGTRHDENPLLSRLVEPFYANFENQALVLGANLSNSNLRYANGRYATMVRVDLRGSDLRGAFFNGADLTGANFQDANLQEADLREAKGLTEKQLNMAKNYVLAYYNQDFLKRLGLPIDHNQRVASYNLSNVKFPEANLHGADLGGFNLQGADLRKVKALTSVQLKVAKNWPLASYSQDQGVSLGFPRNHNEYLAKKDLRGYPLLGANLQGAELEGFNLDDANLQGANLREAKGLTKERLQRTRNWVLAFYSQDFLNAVGLPPDHNERIAIGDLRGYLLRDTNIQGADLEKFDIAAANLQGANLREAKGLTKERLQRTRNWVLAFYSQDFLNAVGLPPDHNERIAIGDLRGYLLRDTNIQGADLEKFDIADANLQGANLREAKGLTKERLQRTRNWVLAFYSQDFLNAVGLPPDHNERIAKKDLRKITLPDANLYGADIQGVNLQDADLRAARGLTKEQLQGARNWPLAYYNRDTLDVLGLPSNHNERIAKKDLSTYPLVRVNLQGTDLHGFNFHNANLREANLDEADLRDVNLQEADLRGIKGLTVSICSSKKTFMLDFICLFKDPRNELQELQEARNWLLAYYSQEHIDSLGLPADHDDRIAKKDLNGYSLRGANLRGAELKGFSLEDANLQSADLRGAKGLTKEQLAHARNWVLASYSNDILKLLELPHGHNGRVANKDLSGYSLRDVNLQGADLEGFNLNNANLQSADLRGAKGLTKEQLAHARNWVLSLYSDDLLTALGLPVDHNDRVARRELRGYSLQGANLRDAHFTGFKLQKADFQEATLRDADFEGAELWWTNLSRANLQGANFLGIKGLIRADCSLSNGLWLFIKCLVIDPRSDLLDAKNWILAYYSEELLSILGLPSDHNERLRAKNLSGYVLHDVNLEGADLTDISGLNWDQLKSALTDDMTQFPKYLRSSKPSKPDGATSETHGDAHGSCRQSLLQRHLAPCAPGS